MLKNMRTLWPNNSSKNTGKTNLACLLNEKKVQKVFKFNSTSVSDLPMDIHKDEVRELSVIESKKENIEIIGNVSSLMFVYCLVGVSFSLTYMASSVTSMYRSLVHLCLWNRDEIERLKQQLTLARGESSNQAINNI